MVPVGSDTRQLCGSHVSPLKSLSHAASYPGIHRSVPNRIPWIGASGQGISCKSVVLHPSHSFIAASVAVWYSEQEGSAIAITHSRTLELGLWIGRMRIEPDDFQSPLKSGPPSAPKSGSDSMSTQVDWTDNVASS